MTAAEIQRLGGRAVALSGDVSVAEEAARMADGAVDALGRLDIVVNSAGVTARNALPRRGPILMTCGTA